MEEFKPLKIPISRTTLTQKEFDVILEPLKSGWVVQGSHVGDFESKFSEFTGAKHSIAVTSCTTALHLSLAALGFKAGDEAILPAFTWISTANIVEHLGGKVVFCDIDLKTFNLDVNQLESKITKKTKAILPVHLFGLSADLDSIMTIAKKYNLWTVEDAACGFGSKYKGKHVGTFGNTGCFSFHPRKAITTGEGGMVTTNSEDLWKKMWAYRDHGKKFEPDFNLKSQVQNNSSFHWPHESFGTNWRLTEMQSALGRYQIKQMPEWSRIRRANFDRISETCQIYPSIRVPEVPDNIDHACYKKFVFLRPDKLKQGWHRNRIVDEINELNVPCYSGGCPEVYREPAFKGTLFELKEYEHLPIAKNLGETSLMFLVHPTLTDLEIEKTCNVIKQVMEKASL